MNPVADSPPPLAFPHPILVSSYSFGLAMLYALITIVVLFQIIRILCYRHNLLHYQFFFLALCLFWSILRAIFWLINPWSAFWENVLQTFAIWAQFAMFAFLVLFYVQIVYKAEGWWLTYRVRVFVVYALTISLCFCVHVTIIVLSVEWGSASTKINTFIYCFVALMFLLLTTFLTYYTYKMWNLKSSIKPQLPQNRTKYHILLMTIYLCLVFLSRAIKAIISIFGIGEIIFGTNMKPALQAGVFFMYLAWEVLPTSFVILLFWHIPRTQKLLWGKFTANNYGNDIPNVAYDSDIRTRAINDGSTTDDTMLGWDGTRSLYADIPGSGFIDDDYDDPATPIIVHTPTSFPGNAKLTPYNTKSPLLQSRR